MKLAHTVAQRQRIGSASAAHRQRSVFYTNLVAERERGGSRHGSNTAATRQQHGSTTAARRQHYAPSLNENDSQQTVRRQKRKG